jgi:hypothetical protein
MYQTGPNQLRACRARSEADLRKESLILAHDPETTKPQAVDARVLRERVSELRKGTFHLIDAMLDGGLQADPAFASSAVSLQTAAEALGAAERGLKTAQAPPRPSQEAAIVLALAATALPFASSTAEEVECWLRVLRVDGGVAKALQSLGVAEMALQAGSGDGSSEPREPGTDPASEVTDRAASLAYERGRSFFTTLDVLFALFETYGQPFDRALYERGITRDQLLASLTPMEQETVSSPIASGEIHRG